MSGTNSTPYDEALQPVSPPVTGADRLRKYFTGRAFLLYGACAVVIAAVIVISLRITASVSPCQGETVPVRDGATTTCVGLTDGSQVFSPLLSGVEGRILQQNNRVSTSGKPWVGIAYLIPMTLSATSSITPDDVLHQLDGAYTAQWEADHGSAYGDLPLIKLFPVNDGIDAGQWRTAATQIKAGRTDSHHIVAVAGLGNSAQNTQSAAAALSKARVAMFGATITADNFNGSGLSGLVRVAPTNTDEVKAALLFLASTPSQDRSALLVQDSDKANDYAQTWSREVQALYPAYGRVFVGQPETFDRTLKAVDDRFVAIAQQVCLKKPKVVFFAGRAENLEEFVGALGAAHCSADVTVISGDDAAIAPNTSTPQDYVDYQRALSAGAVSLFSTALANPDEWSSSCGRAPPAEEGAAKAFNSFESDYDTALGGLASPLDDGSAMMAHDAVITAVDTIRNGIRQTSSLQNYSYQQVTQNLSGLHDTPIDGASGVIVISNYGKTEGDAIDKPLAIVQHQASAKTPVICQQLVVP